MSNVACKFRAHSSEGDELRRRPDPAAIPLPAGEINGPESEFRVARLDHERARRIARQRLIGEALQVQEHFLDLLARQAADLIDQRQVQRTLRESEERLRQFGEASQDVLWIRAAETLQWNYLTSAFETIYGLDRETALHGDNLTSWLDGLRDVPS